MPTNPGRLPLLFAAALPLLGCPAGRSDVAPQVYAPASGATLDRCLVRVEVASKGNGSTQTGPGDVVASSVAYRVNGGAEREVQQAVGLGGTRLAIGFAAELTPGSNRLEVAACDEFAACTFGPAVGVMVSQPSGSPACGFGKGGVVLIDNPVSYGFAGRFPDGRMLMTVPRTPDKGGSVIRALRPDGSVDTNFGTKGDAVLPGESRLTGGRIAPHPEGGHLALLGLDLARMGDDGKFDLGFGTGGLKPLPVTTEAPGGLLPTKLVATQDGAFLMAGKTPAVGRPNAYVPFVARMDRNFAFTAVKVLDASPTVDDVFAIDVAPDGRVVAVVRQPSATNSNGTGALVRGTVLGGLDRTLGTAGLLPMEGNAAEWDVVVWGTDRAAVGQLDYGQTGEVTGRVAFVDASRLAPAIALPVTPLASANSRYRSRNGYSIQLAGAADGALWVATTTTHPSNPTSLLNEPVPGTDIAVLRIAQGAVDTRLGTGGVVRISTEDVWAPISTETLNDSPLELAFDALGQPWVMASAQNTPPAGVQPTTRRGPCIAISKLTK